MDEPTALPETGDAFETGEPTGEATAGLAVAPAVATVVAVGAVVGLAGVEVGVDELPPHAANNEASIAISTIPEARRLDRLTDMNLSLPRVRSVAGLANGKGYPAEAA
jgi:hypothetical protein